MSDSTTDFYWLLLGFLILFSSIVFPYSLFTHFHAKKISKITSKRHIAKGYVTALSPKISSCWRSNKHETKYNYYCTIDIHIFDTQTKIEYIHFHKFTHEIKKNPEFQKQRAKFE